ncbi:hypothetical protein QN277_029402 [Acacia crassicarpa]|uniref:Uncharacterized protein n=1 Tax=Acacia crassicarpa TaxID=499986 RepID=A0AAE1J6Y4_9FABA|nr:hypothetical protein QN277_029402 [Acacia crassicarpa]
MERNSASSAATDVSIVSSTTAVATIKTSSIDKNKKEKQSVMKKSTGGGEEGDRQDAVAVHSQVIRIKQEIEKWKEPSPEIRRLLVRDIKRQRSRSPLGVAERAILTLSVTPESLCM